MTWNRIHIQMRALIRDLLVCIGLALIFTFLGVYDSDNLAWPSRIVFWTVIMCLGGLVLFLIEPLIFGRLLKNHHPVLQILVISAIISVPIAIFLTGLNTQFEFNWPLKNWAMQYVSVIIISVIVVVGRYVISQVFAHKTKSHAATGPQPSATEKFLERLPVKFRTAKLLAVSSEGHYLRVYTDKGSTLILMRISDAIKELGDTQGLQVHRSWWVTRDGIKDSQKTKGRRLLILKSGETVPVSRSFLSALKDANLDR